MEAPLEIAQKKIDKALKRNLEGQAKTEDSNLKISAPQISEAEPITETEEQTQE